MKWFHGQSDLDDLPDDYETAVEGHLYFAAGCWSAGKTDPGENGSQEHQHISSEPWETQLLKPAFE